MDAPPIPKPRSVLPPQNDPAKQPVPLPRTKIPEFIERSKSSSILRSFSSVSKATGDVANKVASTAKAVKADTTKFYTSKSSIKLRKKLGADDNTDKHVSLPCVDMTLFENIQFHSPMLEQKRYKNDDGITDIPSLALNASQFDELSVFSSNSDSNTGSVSDFSRDSTEFEHNTNSNEIEQTTYDTPRQSRTNSIMSDMTAEAPERRVRKASEVSFMRNNSMYENWTLPLSRVNSKDTPNTSKVKDETTNENAEYRPSKSTIIEFDPLNTSKTSKRYDGLSNELLLLESFLIGDTYGSIISTDSHEDAFEFTENDYFNPPTPPERSDSLFSVRTDPLSVEQVVKDSNKAPQNEVKKSSSSSVIHKFSQILKLDNVLHKPAKQEVNNVQLIEKPPINNLQVPYYCGVLTRNAASVGEDLFKNPQSRYCVLASEQLMCYTDPTNSVLKEAYSLDNVHSVQIVLPISTSTNPNSFCFELMVSSGGGRHAPRKVIFSGESAAVRRIWTHNIAAHLTIFPTKFTTDFTRCGWCYLKEGVTGEWHGAWVILHRRVLAYYIGRETTVYTVDLRKVRCVVTQEADDETKRACQSECNDNLLLDCPNATLYLHFPYEKELKSWRFMIRLAAHNNGTHLYHQQLTKEDVPVIVDKCLSFVYAHGSLSEGIYRRAGSNATISDLLTRFRRDAWSVQLTHGELTEHDVAGALKRFFRELPEPLIPRNKHQELLEAQAIQASSERFEVYKRVMSALPVVVANTARKLFAHLNFLQSMTYANRMGSENLAAVWAPTLMPAAMTNDPVQNSWNAYLYVIKDLIVNFECIWEPTEAERRREAAIRRVLVKVYGSPSTVAPKAAGDLKAWIYVHDKNTCYQIALTPNKTCSDILIELSDKAKTYSHLLMLEEIICDNSMRRIVHPDEIVLDVVLRWGYWDEEDRKDNYLLLQENSLLQQIEAMRHSVKGINGLVKFANETTKHFKSHYFALEGNTVCYYKDKQGSQKVEEWKIKDYVWYLGHEPKRPPSTLWSITFIPKNNKAKRSKDKPWFGNTMAGIVGKNDFKWIAALMFSEHSEVLPTPRLIDT